MLKIILTCAAGLVALLVILGVTPKERLLGLSIILLAVAEMLNK
jgi:hypothetical protein